MTKINVEQAKIKHSEVLAHHVVAIIDQKNTNIVDRIEKLEADKNAKINIISGDISVGASNSATTVTIDATTHSDTKTVIVPVSIFVEEPVKVMDVDATQNIERLSAGLSKVSLMLSNLEFLNG